MLTREEARGRVPSPCTWSRGMRTSSTGWSSGRTTERKNPGPGICSTDFGSRICSCRGLRRVESGHCCAPTRLLDSPTAGVRSSSSSTSSTRVRSAAGRPSRPSSSGSPCLRPRSRLATRTCCSRTLPTGSPTSRTLEPSSPATCARRSLSTRARRRRPSAISPRSPCPGLLGRRTAAEGAPRSLLDPWTPRTGTLTSRSLPRSPLW
mmetsp:Transcript_8651/g.23494  ORF Transcript_8651/g.23494 Transcript_8651/m.23494 type:complete len:207 (-) Transcript_8651:3149-3769(-)